MDLTEYRWLYEGRDVAPGWDAIDARLGEVYGQQKPLHWGSELKAMLGGPDPLDGVSVYQCRDGGIPHLHFCTYGYSSLYYDEECAGQEYSGWGFEMTFRLASPLPPPEEPHWVIGLLNNLARYVWQSKRWFEPYHCIPANGPIRLEYPTDLVGLVFLPDPVLAPVDSPNGRVEFLQAFGITSGELKEIQSNAENCQAVVAQLIDHHRLHNPPLVTDLDRTATPLARFG